MIAPKRIGVLCNVLEDVDQFLRSIKTREPGAFLVAIVPLHAELNSKTAAIPDQILRVELSPRQLLLHRTFRVIIRQLRAESFDVFIVRFGTLKLRVLAALAGAKHSEIWLFGGPIFPMAARMNASTREYCQTRLLGWKTAWRIWKNVHFTRVRPACGGTRH